MILVRTELTSTNRSRNQWVLAFEHVVSHHLLPIIPQPHHLVLKEVQERPLISISCISPHTRTHIMCSTNILPFPYKRTPVMSAYLPRRILPLLKVFALIVIELLQLLRRSAKQVCRPQNLHTKRISSARPNPTGGFFPPRSLHVVCDYGMSCCYTARHDFDDSHAADASESYRACP